MLVWFCLCVFVPPRGAHPDTYSRYEAAMRNGTFTCFNGERTIALEKVNDDFLDCSDGSDEPGTALNVGGTFYCENRGGEPRVINAWSVNDGVCDCCDGSDEAANPRVTCANTCGGAPVAAQPPLLALFLASLWKI